MFKYLLSFLAFTSIALGSVSITPTETNNGWSYDLDVQFDFSKYINAQDFLGSEGAQEGQKIWYETMTFKPSETGTFIFDNYASDIAVGATVVNETELLFYTDVPENDYIIDMPWAFRTSDTGFGAGYISQESESTEPITLTEFYGELDLIGGDEYIVVFSSFVPDAYGTLDVTISGDSSATFGVVPEPTSFALMVAFGTFMFVAIRKRNK